MQEKIDSKMAEPAEKSAVLMFNRFATERLREAATLLSQQQDNPYRVGAYRRAADAVAALDQDLRDVMDRGGIEALEQIPGIGRSLGAALAEMVRTGRWAYLERLRGSGEPHDVFCAIPGVGPELARRLHETLHVETLEQLEAALYDPDAKKVAGIGPRRLSPKRPPPMVRPFDSRRGLLRIPRRSRSCASARTEPSSR